MVVVVVVVAVALVLVTALHTVIVLYYLGKMFYCNDDFRSLNNAVPLSWFN
jgi:hypothetical protein